jgi:putative ABC transport system substrate-binding protein
MRRSLTISIFFIIILCGGYYWWDEHCLKKPTIILLQTASHPTLDRMADSIKNNLHQTMNFPFTVELQNGQGSIITLNMIANSIMQNNNVHGVVALGSPALLALTSYGTKERITIPIWYGAVSYPEQCGIEKYSGHIAGESDLVNIDTIIAKIKTLPSQNIGFLYCASDIGSTALLAQLKNHFTIHQGSVIQECDVTDVMEMLCNKSDIIIIPTDNMIASAIEGVINIAKKYHKPLFMMDKLLYEKGGTYWEGIDYDEQAAIVSNRIISDWQNGNIRAHLIPQETKR